MLLYLKSQSFCLVNQKLNLLSSIKNLHELNKRRRTNINMRWKQTCQQKNSNSICAHNFTTKTPRMLSSVHKVRDRITLLHYIRADSTMTARTQYMRNRVKHLQYASVENSIPSRCCPSWYPSLLPLETLFWRSCSFPQGDQHNTAYAP